MGFDEQLAELNDALIEMGMVVERAIMDASKALIEQDSKLAKEIIALDDEIDQREREIESLCLRIMLQRHPIASDLRLVSSVMKIATDLERIGDHASDISGLVVVLSHKQYSRQLEHIPHMAEATMKMVVKSIDAFVNKDLELANEVIADDDLIDSLFETVKGELVEQIRNDRDNSDQAINLVMVAKYFERIGDHTTNIAEWVVFSLTGIHKDSRIM
ncbi:MAG: phosphate signaling complex protein PhoU [Coriobacteriia bacterium]|nr:phosphate signaling complex protein PhoU [Coriobacteriia bacterium]